MTSPAFRLPAHLDPANGRVAQEAASGRWFITMGHPGFNLRANNRDGFATKAAAEHASMRLVSGRRG